MPAQNKKILNIVILLSILGALLVSVKIVISSLTIDETFLVLMPYRIARGEKMFDEIMSTNQSSGFLAAILIKIFLHFNDSAEGLVVFLRICGIAIQFLVSAKLFFTIRRFVNSASSYFVAVIFFSMFPKLSSLPDYTNLNIWFSTLTLCFLLDRMFEKKRGSLLLVMAGISYSIAVLSYPSTLLLLPVIIILLANDSTDIRKNILLFFLTCLVCATVFLVYLQATTGLKIALGNITSVLSGDSKHANGINILGENTAYSILREFGAILLNMTYVLVIPVVLFFYFDRKKRLTAKISTIILIFSIVISFLPFLINVIKGKSYDELKIYFVSIPILLIICIFGKEEKIADKNGKLAVLVLLYGGLDFVGVVLLSNLPVSMNLPFLELFFISGLCVFAYYYQDKLYIEYAFAVIALFIMLINSFTLKESAYTNNILNTRTVSSEGIEKYCFVNSDYNYLIQHERDEFVSQIFEGEDVLVVMNNLNIPVLSLYLEKNVKISHYSTTSTPTYNEMLIKYWDEHPHKKPSAIVVDKSIGKDWYYSEDSWIYSYVNDNYSCVFVGEMIEVYR